MDLTNLLGYDDFINEMMASQLVKISEPKRKVRGDRIQIDYQGMSHRKKNERIKTIKFYAVDPEGSQRTHNVHIEIPDYRAVSRDKKWYVEDKLKAAVESGDIYVSCTCEDFLYKGYKYMADIGDYGIESEDREPVIRNPNLEGAFCKHILASFNQFEDFYPRIIRDILDYSQRTKK